MTTISKNIGITEDRRLYLDLDLDLDLPEALPQGPAELYLTINPTGQKLASAPRKPFVGLFGILKNKQVYDGDGVELQRQWRDKWVNRAIARKLCPGVYPRALASTELATRPNSIQATALTLA